MMGKFWALLSLLPFLGAFGFMGYKIYQTFSLARRLHLLATEGFAGVGKVLKKDHDNYSEFGKVGPPFSPIIYYEFKDALGRLRKGKGPMPYKKNNTTQEGGPIGVLYLMRKPRVNLPQAVVEEYWEKLNDGE